MSTRVPQIGISAWRVVLATIGLFAFFQTQALASTALPPDRAALVFFKCIPYNQAWEDADEVVIEVVAIHPAQLDRATTIADYLKAISEQAHKKDPSVPSLSTSVSVLTDPRELAKRPDEPDVLFLVSGDQAPAAGVMGNLAQAAISRSILIVSESEERLEDVSSLAFVVSTKNNRPEIVIHLERSKAQGARFKIGLVRLARVWERTP
ncbi:MAG: YfiR/HmsC family protein [Candidatus Eisenbacteria bacterium]